MREIGRVAQGYFPTQDRIVAAIASLFDVPTAGSITVVDAGCGCGKAIDALRTEWTKRSPAAQIKLYGIESDKTRATEAHQVLSSGPGGGMCLWSAIEDATLDVPASLLYFNPPYDRIRKGGRLELLLFNKVRDWAARNGHLVLIVPDYILADTKAGLAEAVERDFKLLALYRYPEPEYTQFKQCVLIAQRREKALNRTKVEFPEWARNPAKWKVLPLAGPAAASLLSVADDIEIRRTELSKDLILETLSKSPLRSSLLREAMAPAPKVERPLLPLRDGHLALALAGGLCDGVIEDEKTGVRFMVKGTLESKVCCVTAKKLFNAEGVPDRVKETHRTRYCMNVRCLREDGTIENYSSNEGEPEPVEVLAEEGEDDAASE